MYENVLPEAWTDKHTTTTIVGITQSHSRHMFFESAGFILLVLLVLKSRYFAASMARHVNLLHNAPATVLALGSHSLLLVLLDGKPAARQC